MALGARFALTYRSQQTWVLPQRSFAPIVAYAGLAVLAAVVLIATRGRLGFSGAGVAATSTVPAVASA